MSREIKFRVWDKEDQVMDWPTEISWDDGGDIQNVDAYHKKMTNNFVLEQFTGLKDKNGKDIYEGDILAWHSNVYRKQDWVGLVIYRGAGFAVQDSDRSYSSSEWLECACQKDANLVEVIGNAHEDGQLLEADK